MRLAILAEQPRRVLDVGAGEGKWGRLLTGCASMPVDACEIWEPAVESYGLRAVYSEILAMDVREIDSFERWDVVVMGDVLEHLPREDAVALVDRIFGDGASIYLTIPISPCPQCGDVYGNPYETHLYDWTHDELVDLGFEMLHEGFNERGTVKIGTYRHPRRRLHP